MNTIESIKKHVADINGCAFVSFDYCTQSTGQVARFVLCVGVDYQRITRANLLKAQSFAPSNELEEEAKQAVINSLQATLGGNNADNRRAGTYTSAGKGMILTDAGNVEIQGMMISHKVLIPGIVKTVNSRPLTIAKEKVKKGFKSYIRLALQPERMQTVRIAKKKIDII